MGRQRVSPLGMPRETARPQHDSLHLSLLVIRCQAGDEDAFARLFNDFSPRTLRYLERLIGDDAEDVHQHVWLGVYRHISQLAAPAAFVTWLFRLVRHRAMDHLRHRRRLEELMDDLAADEAVHDESRAQSASDPIEAANLVDATDLSAAIETLSPIHREVVTLRFQDDLTYEEISIVVGCSIGTVKSRIHNAKRLLHDTITSNANAFHSSGPKRETP